MDARIAAAVLLCVTPTIACCETADKERSHALIIETMETFLSLDRLAREFDPALADLYSDEAVIKNNRVYPDGRKRSMTLDGRRYKTLIKTAMPLAKARNDLSAFSNIKIIEEDGVVKLTCDRYSKVKKHTSPYELHFQRVDDEVMIVFESLESIVLPVD